MNDTILVAYASKHGSTRDVAQVVAKRLELQGLRVELRPAAEVRDVREYGAVVLGAALYTGRMMVDARRFLRRHHTELARRAFAIFAMGPLTTSEHDVAAATKQLDAGLAKFADLQPLASTIFGGVVNPAELRFPFNHMHASDARNWNVIEAWADELAQAVRTSERAPVRA